jgi:hypothetical protein
VSAEKIRPESIMPAAAGDIEELSARCRQVYRNFSKVLS